MMLRKVHKICREYAEKGSEESSLQPLPINHQSTGRKAWRKDQDLSGTTVSDRRWKICLSENGLSFEYFMGPSISRKVSGGCWSWDGSMLVNVRFVCFSVCRTNCVYLFCMHAYAYYNMWTSKPQCLFAVSVCISTELRGTMSQSVTEAHVHLLTVCPV